MTHLTPDKLDLLLDGALDETEEANAAEHLASCATCHARLVEMEGLFAALGSLPNQRIPIDLTAKVLLEIRPASTLTTRVAALLLALEAAVSALLAAWLLSPPAGWNWKLPDFASLLPQIALPTTLPEVSSQSWQELTATISHSALLDLARGWPVWLLVLAASAVWLATTFLLLSGRAGAAGRHEQEATP